MLTLAGMPSSVSPSLASLRPCLRPRSPGPTTSGHTGVLCVPSHYSSTILAQLAFCLGCPSLWCPWAWPLHDSQLAPSLRPCPSSLRVAAPAPQHPQSLLSTSGLPRLFTHVRLVPLHRRGGPPQPCSDRAGPGQVLVSSLWSKRMNETHSAGKAGRDDNNSSCNGSS